ncbi:hypothetical protein [Luteimicrobium subarcticum]|uniref:Y4mF family transcriptional regulator n=1 Tax=Luteimicrobium subarcticum TaxID=620910 RepID=A0A2M8WTC1_9MICO|nr:hypothetical protein [Luteimicrobium subarcticum]PJI94201.1 hypothetical protein CLV34_1688 [Luteimicrobium subarcticum]
MERRFIDTTERLAAVVAEQRRTKHLTQVELAAKANGGRRFIVDLEAGRPRAELAATRTT